MQIDNKTFASLAGYTEKSASVMWGKVKAKLQYMHDNNIQPSFNSGGTPASTPKSAVKATPMSKRKKPMDEDVDDDDEEPSTPSARKPKKTRVKKEPEEDQEDGGGEVKPLQGLEDYLNSDVYPPEDDDHLDM